MPTASPTSSDVAEEIGKAQGGFYEESTVVANDGKNGSACRGASLGAVIVYRKSWFDESRRQQVPGDLGRVARRRQEAQGQGPSDRPDARPHLRRRADLLVSAICGRGAARRSRRTARPSCSTARQAVEFGQVRGRLLEGLLRRRRARLGRFQQQPRLPLRHDQRHANGASIYLEAKSKPDTYLTEKGKPM